MYQTVSSNIINNNNTSDLSITRVTTLKLLERMRVISNPRPRTSFYNTRSPLLQDTYNDNRIRYTQDLFYNYLYKFTNSYPDSSGNNMY